MASITRGGSWLFAAALTAACLALCGCGAGPARSVAEELARPAVPARDDLLEASRAALAEKRGQDAFAGFATFLQRFPADPRRQDAELGFAQALLLLGRAAEARSVLAGLGSTRALMETARSFVVEAREIYPHVDSGARQMLPLTEIYAQLAAAGRPLTVKDPISLEQRLRLEGLLALARAGYAEAARTASTNSDRARARIEQARLELLQSELAAPAALLAQAAAEAVDSATRAEALLLRATVLSLDPAAARDTILDAFAAVEGQVRAKTSPREQAAQEQGGLALNENVRLVFRDVTADLTRDAGLRARLAAAALTAQTELAGKQQLTQLVPALPAELSLTARFALATADQLRDREATILALQKLLPDLSRDPSLEAAALAILGQYALVEQATNQPSTIDPASAKSLYDVNVRLLSRAVRSNRDAGSPNPDLDARFLGQNPAPVPAVLASPFGTVRLVAGVPVDFDLAPESSLALPGRTADFFHVGVAGRTGLRVAAGEPPPGLELTASGRLRGRPTGEGTFRFTLAMGPSEAQTVTIAVAPLGLAGSRILVLDAPARLVATGGTPPYSFKQLPIELGFPLSAGQASLTTDGMLAFAGGGNRVVAMELEDARGLKALEFVLVLTTPPVQEQPAASGLFRQPPPAGNLRLPAGTVGVPYVSAGLDALLLTTGSADSWEAATPLPPGLTLTSGGTLSGVPAEAGLFNVRFVARMSGALASSAYLDLLVEGDRAEGEPLAAFSPYGAGVAVPLGVTTAAATLCAVGGVPPISWELSQGALPEGLTLGPDGVLSGRASAPATAALVARATDAAGSTIEQPLNLRVADAAGALRTLDGPRFFPMAEDLDGDGSTDLLAADCGATPAVDLPAARVEIGRARLVFYRGSGRGLPEPAASLDDLPLTTAFRDVLLPNLTLPPISIGADRRILLNLQPLAFTRIVQGGFEPLTAFSPLEPIESVVSAAAGTPPRLLVSAALRGSDEILLYLRPDSEAAFDGAVPAEFQGAARLDTLDLDGDGRLDLLAQSIGAAPAFGLPGAVLRGESDRRFSTPLAAFGESAPAEVCRLDGDRADDAAFASRYLLLSGRGFQRSPAARIQNPRFVASGDFDGDGVTDLAFANNAAFFPNRADSILVDQVVICLGDGQGRFFTLPPETAPGHVVGLAAGRFDEDARDDLVIATDAGLFVRLTASGR